MLRAISFSTAHQNSQVILPSVANKAQIQLMLDRNLKAVLESDAAYSSEGLKTALRLQISQGLQIPAGHIVLENSRHAHPGAIPLISSSGMAILSDLVRRASGRIQRMRFREGLPLTVRTYSLLKHEEQLEKSRKAFCAPQSALRFLKSNMTPEQQLCSRFGWRFWLMRGNPSPAHATSAIRAASLAALRACLIGAYSEYETFNDVYTSILSQAVIRVELIDDEKSSLSRPLGELAYALVLSCFLEVLQQLRDSNRSLLPFRPVSSMLAGANRQ